MTEPVIDYGTRRKLRQKLGSRTGRRSGTKTNRAKRSGKRVVGSPVKQIKPRVRLNKLIREELARRNEGQTLSA